MLRSLTLALPTALAASAALAQTTAPGFVSTTLTSPGSDDNLSFTLSSGNYLVLATDGLTLHAPGGALLRTLHAYVDDPDFGQFLLTDSAQTFALYGLENVFPGGPFGVWGVGVAEGSPRQIAVSTRGGFGVVFETPGTILAAQSSFVAFEGEIQRLALDSGTWSIVMSQSGNWVTSPAVDHDGDLLLASAPFLGPVDSWGIWRFDASQIAGAPNLPLSAGTLEHPGLWAVRGLVRDPLADGLFAAVSEDELTHRDQVLALEGQLLPQILVQLPETEELVITSALQFLPGDGEAAFLPFQPSRGGTLIYVSDSGQQLVRRALTPSRPVAAVSGPGTTGPGPFDVSIAGGPPGGFGIAAYGPSSLFDPDELVLHLRVPVFLGLDLATLEIAPGVILLDANGNGTLGYANPAGVIGQHAIQVLVLDASGKIAGTSSAAFL